LNSKTGKNYRLLTEAEWEFAARGGSSSNNFKYSGSNNIEDVAWYVKNTSSKKIQITGQKKPNELGIYDMTGNVSEWCSDWFGKYNGDNQTNPTGSTNGSKRVVRGGSWLYNINKCGIINRECFAPKVQEDFIGFRLVYVDNHSEIIFKGEEKTKEESKKRVK
jgi:formylglycine-generating enzyme required for sulfatase activity